MKFPNCDVINFSPRSCKKASPNVICTFFLHKFPRHLREKPRENICLFLIFPPPLSAVFFRLFSRRSCGAPYRVVTQFLSQLVVLRFRGTFRCDMTAVCRRLFFPSIAAANVQQAIPHPARFRHRPPKREFGETENVTDDLDGGVAEAGNKSIRDSAERPRVKGFHLAKDAGASSNSFA